MKRGPAPLALAIALGGALAFLAGPGDARSSRGLRPTANPSAVVAAELAFAREAQEKGQWTAFARFADNDAIMFVPQQTSAKAWLKGRANPRVAVLWQPYAVWMSCDGSLAVTKGAWQRPGSAGYFTTVWKRQKNGDYKWVLDQGDSLSTPLPQPEMIAGQVADCSKASPPEVPAAAGRTVGWSDDKTLEWVVDVKPDKSRSLRVYRWTGDGYEEALRSDVAAE